MTHNLPKLQEILDIFSSDMDRMERAEYLIDLAQEFDSIRVPSHIATKPYDEAYRVPGCESEAFIWVEDQPDGTLKHYFDVLNPQGLSAMAMSVIIGDLVNDMPPDQIIDLPADLVFTIFGSDISMGKGHGLTELVNIVRYQAQQRLNSTDV